VTIIQENPTTKALLVQIPKAIAIAKGLKKGMNVYFLIDEKGRIILSEEKDV